MAKTNGKPSYMGKVSNGGNQVVEAPLKSPKRSGDKKITGKTRRSDILEIELRRAKQYRHGFPRAGMFQISVFSNNLQKLDWFKYQSSI